MGPSRTPKDANRTPGEPSSSKAAVYRKKYGSETGSHKQNYSRPDDAGAAVPGVQKIKAALRQTRRLLAKDKLAADVRVATERKQRALEADLATAERARKERTIAQRYHKVKFFERQKVTRKLKQVQRMLEVSTDKKEKKKLGKALLELRIDLNYILHYPKLKKYISLFPPEVRQPHDDHAASDPKGKSKEEEKDASDKAATDHQREEIRQQIREQMKNGELSLEPEKEEHHHSRTPKQGEGSTKIQESGSSAKRSGLKHIPNIGEDTFFGDDSGGGEDEEDATMDSN
ncbi:hypothetical protein BC835DRAFT_1288400 [Cytidiella melzeri]|nr:hypothetical protein BC835DRAFT_1288400 [Cytidiella melzeri]